MPELYEEGVAEEAFTPDAPIAPHNLVETGLSLGFVTDLVLKTLFNRGRLRGQELAKLIALPFKIIDQGLLFLRETKCIEILSGDMIGAVAYQYNLTDLGRQRARDAMESNGYVGPAPVPLDMYVQQCYRQKVTGIPVTYSGLRNAF